MATTLDAPAINARPSDLSYEDLEPIGPAARTYGLQLLADQAENHYQWIYEQVAEDLAEAAQSGRLGIGVDAYNHPDVHAAREHAESLRRTATTAQQEIGGFVACVAAENLTKLHSKAESLTKRSARIGQEPVTITDTDEKIVLNYTYSVTPGTYSSLHADFEHTFVIIQGGAPKVPGFTFLATLDHTDNGAIVKRIPAIRFAIQHNMTIDDERTQEALDAIDLTQYRTADPRVCEHCHKNRNRKQTFVVYNDETSETKRVGRECLRDYTGIDDPERIAKSMEAYFELLRYASSHGEKPVYRTIDFLTHAATMYRLDAGYKKGMGWDALNNLVNKTLEARDRDNRPMWVEPTDGDADTAGAILAWARNEWEEDNEFAHNVKTALAGTHLHEKSYGIAGAVFAARDRWLANAQKRQERERQAEANAASEWVGEKKQRLTFTLTVDQIKWIESIYAYDGTKPLIIMHDQDGNAIKWFASNLPHHDDGALLVGGVYEMKATVVKHEDHERFGKSTVINRGKILNVISEPDQEEE